jgi:hypothetical protein
MNDINDTNSIKSRMYGSYLNLTDKQSTVIKELWSIICDNLNNRYIKLKEEAEAPKNYSFSM